MVCNISSSCFCVLCLCELVYHLFAVDNIQALLRLIQALASNIIYKVYAVLPCPGNDAGEQGCKAENGYFPLVSR